MSKVVKGYKAMNKDMTCRDQKFVVGHTYSVDFIVMCNKGFHFCENFLDVYNYYPKSVDTIICEVEAVGDVLKENDKSVTNKIKIVKKLSEKELLEIWINKTNSGDGNSGYGNSGYGNSGHRNSGHRNSGHRNSGHRNSGDGNSGDGNSGYGNSGHRNSGDWNSGDGNSGYFNTQVPLYFFNKPSNIEYTKELENKLRSLSVKPILEWIPTNMMDEKEKNENPFHKITGGFLRKTSRHDWRYLSDNDKNFIKSLPNFDNEVFKVISNGVSLLDDTIDIIVNGVTKQMLKSKAKELGLIE